MPRVHNTRKTKAAELLRLATKGPDIGAKNLDGTYLTDGEYQQRYKGWAESWLLPLIQELVPELKLKEKK